MTCVNFDAIELHIFKNVTRQFIENLLKCQINSSKLQMYFDSRENKITDASVAAAQKQVS